MSKSESNHRIVIGGQHVSMGAPMVASLAADGKIIALIDGEDLDTAVDIAMAQFKTRRAA
jgi:hypothetical protein